MQGAFVVRRVAPVQVQVQRVGDAGGGVGDPDLALADLGRVVVEAEAGRGGDSGLRGALEAALQTEVAAGLPAVGGHLGGGAQLVAEEGRGVSGRRHGVDGIGY